MSGPAKSVLPHFEITDNNVYLSKCLCSCTSSFILMLGLSIRNGSALLMHSVDKPVHNYVISANNSMTECNKFIIAKSRRVERLFIDRYYALGVKR